jgi:sterol desaturase/sphingolipid hydroxylase (fatty acid hydroxylase superfamily)
MKQCRKEGCAEVPLVHSTLCQLHYDLACKAADKLLKMPLTRTWRVGVKDLAYRVGVVFGSGLVIVGGVLMAVLGILVTLAMFASVLFFLGLIVGAFGGGMWVGIEIMKNLWNML